MRLDLCKGGQTIPTSSSLSCSLVASWMMSCMSSLLSWREKCKLIVFSGVLSVVDSFFMMIYFNLLLFLFGLLLFCEKKEQAICEYIKYV